MSYKPRILAFAGTLRADAYNKKLVQVAAATAREAGAEVTYLDLRDLPMPIYDGDIEAKEGLPPNARKFKELMLAHQGLLISSGEYNSSITAALKNVIDWATRAESKDEPPLACFRGKVAGLLSASPGALGGLRALVHLRAILGNISVLVIPEQYALSKANEAFAPDGSLRDTKQLNAVQNVARRLTEVLTKLGSAG